MPDNSEIPVAFRHAYPDSNDSQEGLLHIDPVTSELIELILGEIDSYEDFFDSDLHNDDARVLVSSGHVDRATGKEEATIQFIEAIPDTKGYYVAYVTTEDGCAAGIVKQNLALSTYVDIHPVMIAEHDDMIAVYEGLKQLNAR